MPAPYSADLRERVLAACERGHGSHADIARRFSVAESTVSTWWRVLCESGRRTAQPPGRGPEPRLAGAGEAALVELVEADTDATLDTYAARLDERVGITVSPPVLCRTLKRLGLTRKKRRVAPPSRTGPTSGPNVRRLSPNSPALTRPD